MPDVDFTPNLRRHLALERCEVPGHTVAAVLAAAGTRFPRLLGYLLDDQGALRQHVNIFVDGALVHDRQALADPVSTHSRIYVVQALSGG